MTPEKVTRNGMAYSLFGRPWRSLDGFLRHAVILAMAATKREKAKKGT